jgi:hypothetical protein
MSLGDFSADIYSQKLRVERLCLSSKEHPQIGQCLGALYFLSHSVVQKTAEATK